MLPSSILTVSNIRTAPLKLTSSHAASCSIVLFCHLDFAFFHRGQTENAVKQTFFCQKRQLYPYSLKFFTVSPLVKLEKSVTLIWERSTHQRPRPSWRGKYRHNYGFLPFCVLQQLLKPVQLIQLEVSHLGHVKASKHHVFRKRY